jgi:hypothetical protein
MGSIPVLLISVGLAASTAPPPRPVATALGTASVRIMTPALIGAGYGPPLATMTTRDATIALPGGGSTVIRLYEFE